MVVGILLLSVGLVAVQPAQEAAALSGSDFRAGYIIDDSKFYDANAMTQAEIQAFLNARIGVCKNDRCLNNGGFPTVSKPRSVSDSTGNLRCGAYQGNGSLELAAAIIYKVQQACGISAKVILVTLQKEQGLVTKNEPSIAALNRAMGFNCPDTAPCDPAFFGFFNQVYEGAKQLNTYRAARFATQPGVRNIAFYPASAQGPSLCGYNSPTGGATNVNIQNYATAALYSYTPYQPNAAALANLFGTGDSCSSYGNRNFWVYYSTWFGSPIGDPTGALQSVTVSANAVTVTGWAIDADAPNSAVNVRVRGAGWSVLIPANQPNTSAGAGTNHGFGGTFASSIGQQEICVDAQNIGMGSDVLIGCLSVTVPSAATPSRIDATDRYNTALRVSINNFSPGVDAVYIAAGENFPDALSAVPAAASQSAPLLLVASSSAAPSILAEIRRLAPKKIVIVGGTAVITDSVEAELAAIAPVERMSGGDRYHTSLAVGESVGILKSGRAYVATGANFPDAISAAAAAGFQDAPLILVDGTATSVHPDVANALARWGVVDVTIVGGPQAVSDAMVASIDALPGVSVRPRLAGVDRYSTSVAVNRAAFPTYSGAFIATGLSFADGLTGGAVAGRDGSPLFLAPTTCVPSAVIDSLRTAGASKVQLLGGVQALGAGVMTLAPC
ncbi:cell wall-binding repeat-containing protein [Salinibacterium hongtaonis]|uniref:cell wall-binding repeat-containing protein n=1 Tax=Homoserinimonas hongtaonis TaxID=2079791 RepID=UPI001A7E1A4F|nr:cell wall-binding repeat-containing protein [Salinibacterium hongtaonis]